jgi:hypothetical protein
LKKNGILIYNELIDVLAKDDINFKEHLKIEEYNPFFQFWNRRIILFYKNNPIITMYENILKCYQYREIKKYDVKLNISNYTLTLLNYVIQYNYNKIYKKDAKETEHRIGNLIHAKNEYLDKHKITVLDDSPFKEFQLECMGETVAFKRMTRLRINDRLEKGMTVVYRYNPNSESNSLNEAYIFPNDSGSLITNPKRIIIKNII